MSSRNSSMPRSLPWIRAHSSFISARTYFCLTKTPTLARTKTRALEAREATTFQIIATPMSPAREPLHQLRHQRSLTRPDFLEPNDTKANDEPHPIVSTQNGNCLILFDLLLVAVGIDGSQPQSTTGREALWQWELWNTENDRRVTWPLLSRDPCQAERLQMPPAVDWPALYRTAKHGFGIYLLAKWNTLESTRRYRPRQFRNGFCMTKIDRHFITSPNCLH